jgi:hypothetical protein
MLSTILRLYFMEPSTKLDEYGRILGADFKLKRDYKLDPLSFELYILDGSTDEYYIELKINGLKSAPSRPKFLDILMVGLSHLTCIPKSDIYNLALKGFQIVNPAPIPAPQIGYSIIRPDKPHDRALNIAFSTQPPENCVNYVLINFQMVPDGWSH